MLYTHRLFYNKYPYWQALHRLLLLILQVTQLDIAKAHGLHVFDIEFRINPLLHCTQIDPLV